MALLRGIGWSSHISSNKSSLSPRRHHSLCREVSISAEPMQLPALCERPMPAEKPLGPLFFKQDLGFKLLSCRGIPAVVWSSIKTGAFAAGTLAERRPRFFFFNNAPYEHNNCLRLLAFWHKTPPHICVFVF